MIECNECLSNQCKQVNQRPTDKVKTSRVLIWLGVVVLTYSVIADSNSDGSIFLCPVTTMLVRASGEVAARQV